MQAILPVSRYVTVMAALVLALPLGLAQQQNGPCKVTITEGNTNTGEAILPLDPKVRIEYSYGTKGADGVGMNYGVSLEEVPLGACAGTLFMIDGQIRSPQNIKKMQDIPEAKWPFKKLRHGGQSSWGHGDIRVNMTLEVVPGRSSQTTPIAPRQRRMNT